MDNRNPPHPQKPPARTRGQPPDDADIRDDDAAAADTTGGQTVRDVRMGGDTGFDRIVEADEAGLGGGLDQAEEARLGVTDEELEERTRRQGKSGK